MVSVREADEIIAQVPAVLSVKSVLLREATGCVLAEEIRADRDIPPYDRVAMDGFAIDSGAYAAGKSFRIAGIQPAGSEPLLLASPNDCIEVMTGALLPNGTNTVIRYEDGEVAEGYFRPHPELQVMPYVNIHRKGTDARRDDVLLSPGTFISPAEAAILASVGKATVSVYELPRAVVISTGDELVPVDAHPQPHQIRQSNTYALQAAMHALNWKAEAVHIKDDDQELRKRLAQFLNDFDVLILTGGVSKGKFDYLPRVLEDLGVKKLFHQVAQKPGKPFWFGMSNSGKVVFALPGNPVSTYLCFYRYIRPWILRSLHIPIPLVEAELTEEVIFKPTLTYFLQAEVYLSRGKVWARPVAGHGSGDFVNLKNVNAFVELPADQTVFPAGKTFPIITFRPLF
ncbi:MAG: molybdopterin molybdotransferase MoeA [Cyclobacteriaceae bacterium]|nr:molybdopterin molybdotransferase MoeA [Cyclobacteriaceae bacterium]MDW8332110.1 molybdopterin molybdotransferase MoeA [Cyclobacteriaceae bacterium]